MFGALLGMAMLKEITVPKRKGQKRSNPFTGINFGFGSVKPSKAMTKRRLF